MKYVICAVKDAAAQAFARPMFFPSTGVAIRSFCDEINRDEKDNQLFHHPEDFDLYHLGEFDDNEGLFILLETPSRLSRGVQEHFNQDLKNAS